MDYKIALGFGNNTDYELKWNSAIIENAITEFDIYKKDIKQISAVDNERDLLIALLYFLSEGIGGECTLDDTEVLQTFANRFEYRITIGGTCPRAAIAMDILDYQSCMHLVVMNKYIKNLLPENSSYICTNESENFDIHLIFQYPKNSSIKANDIDIRTNRANRIIIGNNNTNSEMKLSEEFFDKYVYKSKVLMISGFNTMTDINKLENRLKFLREKLIIAKKNNIKVYFEDACYISEVANQLTKDLIFEFVDIFSFNEDEMQNYYGSQVNLLNPTEIIRVLSILKKRFNVPTLMVHSKYWAIAYGKNSAHFKDCLKGGVTMATTRFRFGDNFKSKEQYLDTFNLPNELESEIFASSFNKIVKDYGYCVPSVAVKETDVTTIGLGDSFVGGFLPPLSLLKN